MSRETVQQEHGDGRSHVRPRVLVLCSTFPRWRHDQLPDFIERLSTRLADDFRIVLLAPHHAGAKDVERWKNMAVIRYRYFFPAALQRLAYGGGIMPNIRKNPLLLVQAPLLLLAGAVACRRLLSRRRFDLVHAHWIVPQALELRLATLASRQDVPCAVTSHGGDLWAFNGKLGNRLKRWALRNCRLISVVSNAMKPVAAELAPAAEIKVIPMGTETEIFHPPATPASLENILFAGRLSEKKGAEVAVRAFALLRDIPGLQLTIAGDGPLRPRLHALVRELGIQERVTFAGWQDRTSLAELFRSHGLFLFPSVIASSGDQEGLGLTLAEAMASGCTVIASALPAVADLLVEDKTGLSFQPGNHAALAARIKALLLNKSLARSLAEDARKHVTENFSMERTVGEFQDLYRTAVTTQVASQ